MGAQTTITEWGRAGAWECTPVFGTEAFFCIFQSRGAAASGATKSAVSANDIHLQISSHMSSKQESDMERSVNHKPEKQHGTAQSRQVTGVPPPPPSWHMRQAQAAAEQKQKENEQLMNEQQRKEMHKEGLKKEVVGQGAQKPSPKTSKKDTQGHKPSPKSSRASAPKDKHNLAGPPEQKEQMKQKQKDFTPPPPEGLGGVRRPQAAVETAPVPSTAKPADRDQQDKKRGGVQASGELLSPPKGTLADLKKERAKKLQDAMRSMEMGLEQNHAPPPHSNMAGPVENTTPDSQQQNGHKKDIRSAQPKYSSERRKFTSSTEVVGGPQNDSNCCVIL